MIRLLSNFRLIPIVILAAICLFALKVSGIVFDGGYTLAERMQGLDKTDMRITSADSVPAYPKIIIADKDTPAPRKAAKLPWAKEMFNFSDTSKDDVTGSVGAVRGATGDAKDPASDITGSSHDSGEKKDDAAAAAAAGAAASAAAAGPALKSTQKAPSPPKLDVGGDVYPLENGKINSPGERAILGRLQDRREALDNRARELDMRESLIKAAEKRLQAKVEELKYVESRIKVDTHKRTKVEDDRFKGIVAMYSNMKPKDAARIFDRLNMNILVEVATAMKARTMSEILAQMSSDSAERLTVELANRASAQAPMPDNSQLPKIEGKSGTP